MEPSELTSMFLNGRVAVQVGDITTQDVDAIVNAANSSLLGGGGVDGAIHAAGGPEILAACREIRRTRLRDGLPAGEAVITAGGRLRARFVIHTVGPVYGRDRSAHLLASCYRSSLVLAREHGLRSVAFPAISTGAFGYPPEEAAVIASSAVEGFLAGDPSVREVRFVFFTPRAAAVFLRHHRFSTA